MTECSKCQKNHSPSSDILTQPEYQEFYADRKPLGKFLRRSHFPYLCKECIEDLSKNLDEFDLELIPTQLEEKIHFYMEGGLMVLTQNYHFMKGYCCENGCRHCPYGFASSRL